MVEQIPWPQQSFEHTPKKALLVNIIHDKVVLKFIFFYMPEQ